MRTGNRSPPLVYVTASTGGSPTVAFLRNFSWRDNIKHPTTWGEVHKDTVLTGCAFLFFDRYQTLDMVTDGNRFVFIVTDFFLGLF